MTTSMQVGGRVSATKAETVTYEDQAPILTIRQGAMSFNVTPRGLVTEVHLRFAAELVRAARLFEAGCSLLWEERMASGGEGQADQDGREVSPDR